MMRDENAFERAIHAAVHAEINRLVQEESEAALRRVRERLPEVVAGVGVKVAKFVDVQYGQQFLVIRVALDGKEETR